MKNFKKYLPQNLTLVFQALVIWYIAGTNSRKDLESVGMIIVWFIIVVIGYGVIDATRPKI